MCEEKFSQESGSTPLIDVEKTEQATCVDESDFLSVEAPSTVLHTNAQCEQHPAENCAPIDKEVADNSNTTVSVDAAVSVDASVVPQTGANDVSAIDRSARQNAIDSDRDYRRITEKIIAQTADQLSEHTKAKAPLREKLSNFIIFLLVFQFVVLIAILFLNRVWDLRITDLILNVYIISVFVETLAGLIIMIKFAFDSQQEVELIKILNAIITNFKKYDEK